jgi:hypothetical protein
VRRRACFRRGAVEAGPLQRSMRRERINYYCTFMPDELLDVIEARGFIPQLVVTRRANDATRVSAGGISRRPPEKRKPIKRSLVAQHRNAAPYVESLDDSGAIGFFSAHARVFWGRAAYRVGRAR